jgi:hypothetical protein
VCIAISEASRVRVARTNTAATIDFQIVRHDNHDTCAKCALDWDV